jgi:S-adenosylmethionine:tRNA ribosyltransferase-isomerase
MRVSDFDYELPGERIAREPLAERDAARLFVLDRQSGERRHAGVRDLPTLLAPNDLLVLNDTRVLRARLIGRKPTGGRVEILLVEAEGSDAPTQRWRAMYSSSKPLKAGVPIEIFAEAQRGEARPEGALVATLLEPQGDGLGRFELRDAFGRSVREAIARAGELPLPPYLGRREGAEDAERYQTIFARTEGAVAAPTAGLHFTSALLSSLEERGVALAFVTLHVGPGTFLPVRAQTVEDHVMHEEAYFVPERTATLIAETRAQGGRVVAVGTTSLRTLEAAADPARARCVRIGPGRTNLFIYPGYEPRVCDALLTNFHLPRSTLLMLVCAMVGRERLLDAYAEAIRLHYRFYSYGDAMLIY